MSNFPVFTTEQVPIRMLIPCVRATGFRGDVELTIPVSNQLIAEFQKNPSACVWFVNEIFTLYAHQLSKEPGATPA